jgi:hypothetical protein
VVRIVTTDRFNAHPLATSLVAVKEPLYRRDGLAFQPTRCDGAKGFRVSLLGEANPSRAIATVLDDGLANFAEQRRLDTRPEQTESACAQGVKRAIGEVHFGRPTGIGKINTLFRRQEKYCWEKSSAG